MGAKPTLQLYRTNILTRVITLYMISNLNSRPFAERSPTALQLQGRCSQVRHMTKPTEESEIQNEVLTLPDAATLDHVAVAELHGLGTLRSQLSGHDHLKRSARCFRVIFSVITRP